MDNSLLSVIGSSRSVLSILYDGDSKDFLFSTLDRLLIISPIDYKNEIIDDELFIYNRRSIKITIIISKDQVGFNIINLDNYSPNPNLSNNNFTNNSGRMKIFKMASSLGYSLSKDSFRIKTIFLFQIKNENKIVPNYISYGSDMVIRLISNQICIVKNLNLPQTV